MALCGCRPGLPIWLDCSPEAQAERKRRLAELWAKLFSGVRSVSDRGRSVTYGTDFAAMRPLLKRLQDEITACEVGHWPEENRIEVIDYVKGL